MPSSIRILAIQNLTSGIDILPEVPGRFAEVTEYAEQSFVCELPLARIAAGQLVSLTGRYLIEDQEFPFNATGRIEKATDGDGDSVRIEILMRQFDRELWKRFRQTADGAQARLNRLLAAMRGED